MTFAKACCGDLAMGIGYPDKITELMTTFLDVQSRRAQVISSNIANADTPEYIAKQLEFDDFLKEAAQNALKPTPTDSGQSLSSSPSVVERIPTAVGIDGNTVEVGKEMTELTETGMQFLSGTKILQSRLRTLRTAIREGK